MRIYKYPAIILCLCLVFTLLTGCPSKSDKKAIEILDLMEVKKLDEAAAMLQDALKSDPNYPRFLELKDFLAVAYSTRGLAYHNKGDHNRAIADFNKAIKIQPNSAKAYLGRGLTYHKKGEYAQAIADCNKAIKNNPNLAEAYSVRGLAYYKKGDYNWAIADLKKALEIDPNHQFARKALKILERRLREKE